MLSVTSCVILSEKISRCGYFRVELSKICNELLIFESQNAVSVLRIPERYGYALYF